MPINPEAVGAAVGPVTTSWDETTCMLYALAVGAASDDPLGDELRFVTENTEGVDLLALPTMVAILGGILTAPSPLAQIGDYDRRKSVQASFELELHRALPAAAEIESTISVSRIEDKGTAALLRLTVDAADAEGPLFTTHSGIFVRDAGGFGGDPGVGWTGASPPERAPDAVVRQPTRRDQPLLYRLCGDRNPLHSDPGRASALGFERPIMHGQCTIGFVGRALVQTAYGGDVSRLRAFGVRFASPVLPGAVLETSIWTDDDAVTFSTTADGQAVLTGGYASV